MYRIFATLMASGNHQYGGSSLTGKIKGTSFSGRHSSKSLVNKYSQVSPLVPTEAPLRNRLFFK